MSSQLSRNKRSEESSTDSSWRQTSPRAGWLRRIVVSSLRGAQPTEGVKDRMRERATAIIVGPSQDENVRLQCLLTLETSHTPAPIGGGPPKRTPACLSSKGNSC